MNSRTVASFFTVLVASSCVWDELPVDKPEVDCKTVNIVLEISKTTNATVCGANDGKLEMKVTGGEPPYTFSIDGSEEQTSNVFDELESNVYSVVVFDKNRCSATLEHALITVEQFSMDLLTEPNSECINFNGAIDIVVNETNGPYEFQLDSGSFFTGDRIENISHGGHFLTVRDADGCNLTRLVTIAREATGVSWEDDILPIMTSHCATTGCHNGVHLPRDWRVHSQVKTFASTIRKRTQDKSMPAEGSLTEDQIALIACWIDDGAPLN
jgi:hypothetical protein